jgi:hypothetical protein
MMPELALFQALFQFSKQPLALCSPPKTRVRAFKVFLTQGHREAARQGYIMRNIMGSGLG